MRATVSEAETVVVASTSDGDESVSIRVVTLSLNSVSVQLSTLGASILQVLIPSRLGGTDDVVLGFKSLQHMWDSKNPFYLNVIVGRVANRIKEGKLVMDDDAASIQLDRNNGPNHLHGGFVGFSHRIWDVFIITDNDDGHPAVQFTLASEDGDQKYPGELLVKATYSLRPSSTHRWGARLCLRLEATLLSESPTPVNLSQHSYFNLHRHDSPFGCLDHRLTLFAAKYTPIDDTSIPTRKVRKVADDTPMDFSFPRLLRQALTDYAVTKKVGRSEADARNAVESSTRIAPDINTCGPTSSTPGIPYGFDHNYVIQKSIGDVENENDNADLPLVAVLEHEASGRTLTVRSDAPGVQLYTANFLDGVSLPSNACKDSAVYAQWQGICLETQHFPDSICVDETKFPEFARGQCPILRPDWPSYVQNVQYEFSYDAVSTDERIPLSGIDATDGEYFESVKDMWKAQGLSVDESHSGGRSSWYCRAAEYYEGNCDTTLDGVLGGFASISDLDLQGSQQFVTALEHLQSQSFSWSLGAACECGAGIGRVSKGLLLPLGVKRCDLVESSSRLLSAAPDYIGDENSGSCRYFCSGLQDWEPPYETYSLVWIQWVLCYLTDDDAIVFLRRCGSSLVPGGYIVVKENTCLNEGFVLDSQDASVTRSVPYLRQIFEQAALKIVYQRWETNFPDDIFPVPMFALQPS